MSGWEDPDGRRWAAALRPPAEVLATGFIRWLPKAAYPIRHGVHTNSAFALSRALPHARQTDPALTEAITAAARRWFDSDTDYPRSTNPPARTSSHRPSPRRR